MITADVKIEWDDWGLKRRVDAVIKDVSEAGAKMVLADARRLVPE